MGELLVKLKVPVLPRTKEFFIGKYRDNLIGDDSIDLRTNQRHKLRIIRILLEGTLEKYRISKLEGGSDYLTFVLPQSYLKYGISSQMQRQLGKILDEMCMDEMVMMCWSLASLPEFSRSAAIRIVMQYYNVTTEELDEGTFRRYIDRYGKDVIGEEFKFYRQRMTIFLKTYYRDLLLNFQSAKGLESKLKRLNNDIKNAQSGMYSPREKEGYFLSSIR